MSFRCQLQFPLAVGFLSVVSHASCVSCPDGRIVLSISHTPQPIGSAHNDLRFEHDFLPVFAFVVSIHAAFYGLGLRSRQLHCYYGLLLPEAYEQ